MAVHLVGALKSFLANTFALTAFSVFIDQSLHKFFEPYCPQYSYTFKCVVPENIHSCPIEGICFWRAPSPCEFQLCFINFVDPFSLLDPLLAQEFPILSTCIWGSNQYGNFPVGYAIIVKSSTLFGHCTCIRLQV